MSSSLVGRAVLVGAFVFTSVSCGSGGGGTKSPATVTESLNAFGVDTAPTPRVGSDQAPLPSDYRPFGTSHTFNRTDQLAIVGTSLSPDSFGFDSTLTVVEEQVADLAGNLSTQALFAPPASTTPWAISQGSAPAALRTAAGGDLNGDGLDELVVVAYTAEGSWLQVFGNDDAAYAAGAQHAVDLGAPLSIALAVADFHGDGKADAAVAWTETDGAHVQFFRFAASGIEPDGDAVLITPEHAGAVLDVEVAAGNLDYDPGYELALVVNESFVSGGNEASSVRWFVLDDGASAHVERGHGYVRGSADGVMRTAVLAGLAVGDIDGDGLDEVVLGGLTGLDPGHTCSYAYVLVALDDLKNDLATLGAAYVADALADTPAPTCDSASPLRLRKVHVRTFHADEQGSAAIQVNQLTYRDFRLGVWAPAGAAIPLEYLFGTRSAAGQPVVLKGTFDATTSAFAAADFTHDKVGDVALVSQLAGPVVRLWTHSRKPGDTGETWHVANTIPLAPDPGVVERPLLVVANVKKTGLALQFSDGSYNLVFTEPIVLAALAAAPCSNGLGQNTSSCVTAFGTAHSDTVETENTYTFHVGPLFGVTAGTNIFGLKLETEVTAKVQLEWEWKTDTSYTLTQRVVYSTGGIEDGVIFTTVPYDVYTYTVLSHPDPQYIGHQIVIALPRAPIHILTERSFYNDHVPPGSPTIGSNVFMHTPGDPHSYRSAASKDALIATYTGYASARQDVGQGGGNTYVEVNVCTESGSATSYGIAAELEVKVTVGPAIGGYNVGGGASSQLTISHGSESLYAGTVANIPAGSFGTGRYSFGLFTYVYDPHDGTTRPFEVLDYWVE